MTHGAQPTAGAAFDAPFVWRRPIGARDAATAGIRLATLTDIGAVKALGPEWSALFEACGRPHQVFQTFAWLGLWAALYLDRRTRLAIVTGRIGGRLVLVWPLVVRRQFGLRVLAGMGDPLSQYVDALIAPEVDEAMRDAAFDHVMTLPADVVALRRVRADAALAPLLERRLGAAANVQASPYVDLADRPTAKAFEARFSSKLRTSRRRLRRRLEERGPVTFQSHGPSAEAAGLVATALAFKRDWARQAGVVSPALRDPRFERFFIMAAQAGDRAPDLRVSELRCGDEIFGVEISIACGGHLFGHVLAPRPGFGPLGLGKILAESTITSALDQGYASVDLLAPADSYKREWTAATVAVGDYSVPRSLVGRLYSRLWLTGGRDLAKTLARRLRPLLVRLIPSGPHPAISETASSTRAPPE